MARKVSGGVTGEPSIGAIQVAPTAVVTAATDQNITLSPTGTGSVVITNNVILNAQSDLRFADADSSNWVAFQGASTIAANVTWTLPSADGTNGQALTTNGSGTLSCVTSCTTISDETTNATRYLTFLSASSGSASTLYVSSAKFTVNPSTGVLTTVSITESSSIALKENVAPIENALDSIMRLVGVTYDRRDGSKKDEAGLIAEEVDKILPNLVTKDQEGRPDAIHYTKLTAYLIEAVKSLKTEINSLKGI